MPEDQNHDAHRPATRAHRGTATVSGRRIELAALLVIVAFAIAIRWDGLTYGFPLIVHPDEPRVADAALDIVRSGDLHPRTLLYPSFLVYLDAAAFGLVRAASGGTAEAATYYYWGRIATLATSVITVLIVFFTARRLGGFVAAAAAAMTTAAALLHAASSVLITTDVPMAMWTTATVAAALALIDAPSAGLRRYAATGALVGLAVGTKYNAVIVAIAVAVAHLMREKRVRALVDARLLTAASASIGAFVLVTPYALLDSGLFRDFLTLQRQAYSLGHAGNEAAGVSYAFYASTLVHKLGAGALGAAILGLLWQLVRDPRRAAVLASFPLAYFAFMGAYPVHFERNMVPLVPILAVLTGVGVAFVARAVAMLSERLGSAGAHWAAGAAAAAAIALVVMPQAAATEAHMARVSLPDTRVLAKVWIETNLPAGVRIAREHYTPPLDPERFEVVEVGYFGLALRNDLDEFDYLVASSGDYGRFLAAPERYGGMHARYSAIFDRYETIEQIAPFPSHSSGPIIRILAVKR